MDADVKRKRLEVLQTERIDVFWKKVFEVKSGTGEKCATLKEVAKSSLSLQCGSAGVERSLSLSKNVLTAERAHLDEKTVMGLGPMKDYCSTETGAHNISTLNESIISAVEQAHKKHIKRKNWRRMKEELQPKTA